MTGLARLLKGRGKGRPMPSKWPTAFTAWLTEQGVTGYAQSLLVLERFGYPAFSSRLRMS